MPWWLSSAPANQSPAYIESRLRLLATAKYTSVTETTMSLYVTRTTYTPASKNIGYKSQLQMNTRSFKTMREDKCI